MDLFKKYIELDKIVSKYLEYRAEYAGIYSTLIPDKQLAQITNKDYKIFLSEIQEFLNDNKAIMLIKRNPILFMVIQTYIISNVVIKNSNSFYEKCNQEYKIDIKRLQFIFQEIQEEIWINTHNKLQNNNIKFIIPPKKTYAYRYVQYPLSQVILTTSEMDRILRKLNIKINSLNNNNLTTEDFKKIVNANKDIMNNIYNKVSSRIQNINFIEEQKEIITQQLYSYYITVNFTQKLYKKIYIKKEININNLYSLKIKENKYFITLYQNTCSKLLDNKSIDNLKFSMTDDGIKYLLWYKVSDEENWTYTNVIYKKYCKYCVMCENTSINIKWIMKNFNIKPFIIGKYLFMYLNPNNIEKLINLNSNYIDKFFTYPIYYSGNRIARNTYEYKNGPILNISDKSLILINGQKITDKYFFNDCKTGEYNIHVFVDNHYIKTIIYIENNNNINNMNNSFFYILGERKYKEKNSSMTRSYLYLLAGKKIKKNKLLNIIEVNINAGQ